MHRACPHIAMAWLDREIEPHCSCMRAASMAPCMFVLICLMTCEKRNVFYMYHLKLIDDGARVATVVSTNQHLANKFRGPV